MKSWGSASGGFDTADADIWLATKDTDNLSEGSTNLYYPSADKSKLALIEALATADQSAAEIRDALQTLTGANRLNLDYVKEGSTNFYLTSADLDTQANHKLKRNSTTQIQLEALAAGTHDFVTVAGERIDISTPETCLTTDNLLAADGTDSGGACGASTKYYAYLSNSSASFAASSLRLSATSPTNGYLAAAGNGAKWRYVGFVFTNASTQWDVIGALFNLDEINAGYPEQATLWHDEAIVENGNAITRTIDATSAYGIQVKQNVGANGDIFRQQVYLKAGTYKFSVLGYTANDRGIIDWYLDRVKIVNQQDWYSAGAVANVQKDTTGITITTSGYHVLQGIVNGQHGSSSGYSIPLMKYWFSRTG